jgi:hypothetical protein
MRHLAVISWSTPSLYLFPSDNYATPFLANVLNRHCRRAPWAPPERHIEGSPTNTDGEARRRTPTPADLSSQDQPPRCPRGHRGHRTAEEPGAATPAHNSTGTPRQPGLPRWSGRSSKSPEGERPLPNTARTRGGRPAATVSRAAFARRRPPAAAR